MTATAPLSIETFSPIALGNASPKGRPQTKFVPYQPQSLAETGLAMGDIESLALKLLLHQGALTGKQIAQHLRLPFNIVFEALRHFKSQMLLAYKASAAMNDFEHELTDSGAERAKRWMKRCTFCGAAPVPLRDYVTSVQQQTLRNSRPTLSSVLAAFHDLSVPDVMISQIGQAITAGRGLFLYGPPGNGKTSIAERVIRSVSDAIWIPRTITVSGEIVRLFDPSNHEELPLEPSLSGSLDTSRIDLRWVRIRRPTVIAGGELTLEHLEMQPDKLSGIIEAPLQMKSNGGALVIDDFGRQRLSPADLLNRWIVPLEKGVDYQTLPAGRQIQVPFDQLIVFATNVAPSELVDEAFLRRIPYKVEVAGPTETQFRELFETSAQQMGVTYSAEAVEHLLDTYYRQGQRGMRYCHVRDLLLQIKHLCEFHERPAELTPKNFDVAAHNYFAGL